jgi:hypothetical protein
MRYIGSFTICTLMPSYDCLSRCSGEEKSSFVKSTHNVQSNAREMLPFTPPSPMLHQGLTNHRHRQDIYKLRCSIVIFVGFIPLFTGTRELVFPQVIGLVFIQVWEDNVKYI